MSAMRNNQFLAKTQFKKNYQITDNYSNDMLTESVSRQQEYWHILMVSCALLIYLFLIICIYKLHIENK